MAMWLDSEMCLLLHLVCLLSWGRGVGRKVIPHGIFGLRGVTTGFRFFAECLMHSAKAQMYSAKPLPSAALGKEHTAKN